MPNNRKPQNKRLEDYGISWIDVHHTMVIIGWGVDPVSNVKYWIVRNSVGPIYGIEGNWAIERGVNFMGIESNV